MTETVRPLRADARRNRERILASAGELFARLGTEAQMDQIAEHCGLGLGTLYRHFPTKEALVTAIVSQRFDAMAALARSAELIEDPGEAFATVLRSILETADGDAALQVALLEPGRHQGNGTTEAKAEFRAIAGQIIDRAIAAGAVRGDLTVADFPLIIGGVMSTMYFKPDGSGGWRRHLDLVLDGLRTRPAGAR